MRLKLGLLTLACVLLALSYPYLSNNVNYSRVTETTTTQQGIVGRVGLSIEKAPLTFEAKIKLKSSLILDNGKEKELIDPFTSFWSNVLWNSGSSSILDRVCPDTPCNNQYGVAVKKYLNNFPSSHTYIAYFTASSTTTPSVLALGTYYVNTYLGWIYLVNTNGFQLQGGLVYALKLTEYGGYFGGSYSNLLDTSQSYVFVVTNIGTVYWFKPDGTYITPSFTVSRTDPDGNDCIINNNAYNCHVTVTLIMYYSSDYTIKEVRVTNSIFGTTYVVVRLVFNQAITVPANTPVVVVVDVYAQ